MLEQFLNHIERNQLCRKSDRILLAVSGGIDSMVMLNLFESAGYAIGVAHCNFLLRGDESDADEQFIMKTCRTKNIPFYSTRFSTTEYARLNRISIQMAARELRYAWFDELLDSARYNFVATAHHLNDSIETVLLNWTHGGSSEGLLGIPVKNNRIIRPLLFASRPAIEVYAQSTNLSWREDASNLTDNYPRNFLRHQVVPKLKKLNASFEETFKSGLEKLRAGHRLEQLALSQLQADFIKMPGKQVVVEKELFEKIEHSSVILWRLIRNFHFTLPVCEDIIHALPGQPGKRFLSPTHQLVIDRSTLIITEHTDFWNPTEIGAAQTSASLGPWNMTIEKVDGKALPDDPDIAVLDMDHLHFPVVWRTWQPGDFFYPLGMEHKKKVSDFLIDNKVPLSNKPHVTVLESAGRIIWVVGYRIDNRFKVSDSTKQAVQFTVSPYFN